MVGDRYSAGLLQLLLVYSVPLLYFWVFGHMCMAYVMAPLHWLVRPLHLRLSLFLSPLSLSPHVGWGLLAQSTASTRIERMWRVWGRARLSKLVQRAREAVRRDDAAHAEISLSERAPLIGVGAGLGLGFAASTL